MNRIAQASRLSRGANGLRRYLQIILALLRREEESRRHAPMESLVNLFEPIILIGTIALFWWFLGTRNHVMLGEHPILFYATGFFSNYFFIYISRRMRSAIEAPINRFPIERQLDHILVHIILRTADYTILGIVLFGAIFLFVTPRGIPYDFVPIGQACLAIIMLGFGWGTINLILGRAHWAFVRAAPVFNRGLVIFSGVFFVPDFLAPHIREILSYNPLLHAILLFRSGFYPDFPNIVLDTGYLAKCSVVLVALALALERFTQRAEGA
jgi:capsular polysaccharide transport system permease protein